MLEVVLNTCQGKNGKSASRGGALLNVLHAYANAASGEQYASKVLSVVLTQKYSLLFCLKSFTVSCFRKVLYHTLRCLRNGSIRLIRAVIQKYLILLSLGGGARPIQRIHGGGKTEQVKGTTTRCQVLTN